MNYSARGCMYCEGSCNKECLPNQDIIKTEEDAKIFFEALENIPEPNDKLKKAFIDFGKQETKKEKMYSEEEVKDIMAETWIRCVGNDGNDFKEARDKILELFKNKLYNITK